MFKNKIQAKLHLSFLLSSIILMFSACSIPIPLGDLLPELGSNNSGSFIIPHITTSGFDIVPYIGDSKSRTITTTSAEKTSIILDNLDLDGANSVIDLTGRDELQSRLVSVSVNSRFLLKKIGNYDSNGVVFQAYLAPANGSSITSAANALGSAIPVDFINGSQTIEVTVGLNSEQIQAINDRKLRLGFSIKGTISGFDSPTVGLSYDVESLKITDLKANVNEQFPTGNNGAILSIANIDTGIAKVNSLTLDYTAKIKQSSPEVLKGTAKVALYLASSSETNLYQEINLVKVIDVDIVGDIITGKLSVQNPLVATVLVDNKVRYGVKITGDGIGIEAVAGSNNEVMFEYEITKLTGTAGVGL